MLLIMSNLLLPVLAEISGALVILERKMCLKAVHVATPCSENGLSFQPVPNAYHFTRGSESPQSYYILYV